MVNAGVWERILVPSLGNDGRGGSGQDWMHRSRQGNMTTGGVPVKRRRTVLCLRTESMVPRAYKAVFVSPDSIFRRGEGEAVVQWRL